MCIQEFPLWIGIWRGGKSRHMSAMSTMSSSEQPSSVSSPLFLELNTVHIWRRRPKMANNAAIQHVIFLFLSRSSVIWRHFEYRSQNSSARCKLIPWLLIERIFLIRTSCQDRSVYARRGAGKPIFLQLGQTNTRREVEGSWVLVEQQLKTHQETGMLEFPLVMMQFFSSGLIMVG